MKEQLIEIADKLPAIAGELMYRACQDPIEHENNCKCNTCKAFLTVHEIQNKLEKIIKEL